jgi:hypothetical protein
MNVGHALALLASSALLASCAGSSATIQALPPSNPAVAFQDAARATPGVQRQKVTVTIRISIPKEPRNAHYISPATKGMTLAFTGPTTTTIAVKLTRKDPRCSGSPLTCTIGMKLLVGRYTVTLDAYDEAPIAGAIPSTAKLLSTARNAPLKIVRGTTNRIGVTLDGVPASLTIGGLPSATAGTAFSTPQAFSVTADDADGYTIVGTYTAPITLTDSDTSGATTISTSGPNNPPAGQLLGSNDTATLNYNGSTIQPVTIAAAAHKAIGGSAVFRPIGNDVVTLATDANPGATPGTCPAGNSGDLRYELCYAIPGDAVIFDTTAMCGGAPPCTIVLSAPLPPIIQSETIDGGSFGSVTIDGAGKYRAFFVDSGTVSIANLQI